MKLSIILATLLGLAFMANPIPDAADADVTLERGSGGCSSVRGAADTTCHSRDGRPVWRPEGEQCGPNVCKPGTTCCKSSCGYCTKRGQGCTKEYCLPQKCG